MKRLLIIAFSALLFTACSKDKFGSVPEIKYKSISPDIFYSDNTSEFGHPILTIRLRDAEGDFGPLSGNDSSYVYVKNTYVNPAREDSFLFPKIVGIPKKNLDIDVTVDIKSVALGSGLNLPEPVIDTVFFEVYVKDFAKNKSNVVQAGPLYIITP